ncbi:hypothetical protein [Falsihalocynthiibacter arcticus]|nr:hypothetical protein [Falsihalocynthiibacter arcticus]
MRVIFAVIAAGILSLIMPNFAAAQEATGQITTQIDGKDFVFTIISQADAALGLDDADAKSAFAPQSEQFAGIVSLALWATEETSGIPLMLNIFHRVSGEPTEVDQFFSGFLFYAEGGEEWGWVADLSQDGSTISVERYVETETSATVAGQFSTTAYYEAADQDEPDLSRSISISGRFEAVLPRIDTH